MRIFYTDNGFKANGVSLPGIPFLADSYGNLIEPANRYLYFISAIKGRTASPKTWKTYADHLYEFFSFLEENGLVWNCLEAVHLASWRNSMLARQLARQTCNSRIRTVSAFYIWCKRTNLIGRVPFDRENIFVSRVKGFLAHVHIAGNRLEANELSLPSIRPLPKFLPLAQASTFIDSLSPKRTWLIAWLMLLCGLRREEAASLDIRVLPSLAGQDPKKSIKMTLDPSLTPTKGSKERWVNLPYPLAGRLHDYLMGERLSLAKLHKKKSGRHTTKLFLTQFGDELSVDGLDEQFRLVSKRCGIKCTPHMLRHTFAVHELIRMSGKPKINALGWVRDRLGHASVTTTEIYVKAADLVSHDDLDGYVAEILEAMAHKAH